MSERITIEVHRHRCGDRPVAHIKTEGAFTYGASTAGTESFSVNFKAPLIDHGYTVRPGDWVVLRDAMAQCRAWGHVDDVVGGYQSDKTGKVITSWVSVACSSWLSFLGSTYMYAPKGQVDTVGTLMSIQDWVAISAAICKDFVTGSLGVALQKLHSLAAKIRLPESLGGQYIGDAIPVVHDEGTALLYAPKRAYMIDPVAVAGGLPNALSFGFYESSLQELYYGTFVPDTSLIELFPSLEDAPYQPEAKDLASILGRRPVLIYRLRPFRARPLISAVSTLANLNADADTVYAQQAAKLQAAVTFESGGSVGEDVRDRRRELEANQWTAAGTAANVASGQAATRYAQMGILQDLFTAVTWDTTRATPIDPTVVRRVTFNWSDKRRINACTIGISTDPGTGIEAASALGLPITNQQSILEHGLRLTKPTWPFVIPRKENQDWVPYMRSVAAQKMQFEQTGHLMSQGTIELNYTDALKIHEHGQMVFGVDAPTYSPIIPIPVGVIVSVAQPYCQPFYAYVASVQHEYVVTPTGVELAKTLISYTRGLYGIEDARDVDVQLNPAAAAAKVAAATTPSAQAARTAAIVADRDPVPPPSARGALVLARARQAWLSHIVDPRNVMTKDGIQTSAPYTDAQIEQGLEFITRIMTTSYGVNGSLGLNAYTINDAREWCGVFAAYCWDAAGLVLAARMLYFPSTLRLNNYGQYVNQFPNSPTANQFALDYPDPGNDTGREYLALGATSRATDPAVVAFAPTGGDILLVGAAGAPGSHVTIVESFNAVTGIFHCIGGNADGIFPNGRPGHGVCKQNFPIGAGASRYAVALIRPPALECT